MYMYMYMYMYIFDHITIICYNEYILKYIFGFYICYNETYLNISLNVKLIFQYCDCS